MKPYPMMPTPACRIQIPSRNETISAMRTGFAMNPSNPSARKRSGSPFMAKAVSATKGPRTPFSRSLRIASMPFIPGSWMSMKTRSHGERVRDAEGLLAARGREHGAPERAEDPLHEGPVRRAVVDHERRLPREVGHLLRHARAAARRGPAAAAATGGCRPGMRTVKLLPLSTALSTETVPSCSSTRRFTMASPSPVPSPLLLERDCAYGSKIRGRSPGGDADPLVPDAEDEGARPPSALPRRCASRSR